MIQRSFRLMLLASSLLLETSYLFLTVKFRPADLRLAYRAERQRIACGRFCRILRISISRKQADHFTSEATLIASNHIGVVDPVIIASLFPVSFVAMAELNRWPVIGWICRTVAAIFVDRSKRMESAQLARQVEERIEQGVSVVVFPEGTTTLGDNILPFKTGAFEAVAKTPRKVLPVCINILSIDNPSGRPEDRNVLSWSDGRHSFAEHVWRLAGLKSAHLEILVGEPVTCNDRSRKDLSELVRSQIVSLHRPFELEPRSNPDYIVATT